MRFIRGSLLLQVATFRHPNDLQSNGNKVISIILRNTRDNDVVFLSMIRLTMGEGGPIQTRASLLINRPIGIRVDNTKVEDVLTNNETERMRNGAINVIHPTTGGTEEDGLVSRCTIEINKGADIREDFGIVDHVTRTKKSRFLSINESDDQISFTLSRVSNNLQRFQKTGDSECVISSTRRKCHGVIVSTNEQCILGSGGSTSTERDNNVRHAIPEVKIGS